MPGQAVLLPSNIIRLKTVDSTNTYAKALAKEGAASGTVVCAEEQTAGRGRQGNSWVSIPGNLLMSIVLRPRIKASDIGQLSFLSAVALANVLENVLPSAAKLELKWPNDVLINDKKAAGILIETEGHGESSLWVVVGIGVNITHAPPNAVCLYDLGVKTYGAEEILEMLVKQMLGLVAVWEQDGFASIRHAWLKRAYRLGETIMARLPQETLTGVFEGLDAAGALLLRASDGSQRIINSGEVYAGLT